MSKPDDALTWDSFEAFFESRGAAMRAELTHRETNKQLLTCEEGSEEYYRLLVETELKERGALEERERLNGESEARPTRRDILNVIKGYDNDTLGQIVLRYGSGLGPKYDRDIIGALEKKHRRTTMQLTVKGLVTLLRQFEQKDQVRSALVEIQGANGEHKRVSLGNDES